MESSASLGVIISIGKLFKVILRIKIEYLSYKFP